MMKRPLLDNTHTSQMSLSLATFKTAVPATKQPPQAHALDHVAIGIFLTFNPYPAYVENMVSF